MFKKIALLLAFFVTASFATWDFYPIPKEGIGTIEAGFYYDGYGRNYDKYHDYDDWSQMGLKLSVRVYLLQKFELSLQGWGYQFWNEWDCNHCVNGGDGLRDLTLGGRFEVAPMITAFLDFNIPTGRTEWDGEGTNPPSNDEFSIYLGAQFSPDTKMPGFAIGGEAGFLWAFEHDNQERGLDVHAGVEAKYTIPNVGLTPYLGFMLKLRLTESEWEENNGRDHGYNDDGSTQFNLWFGGSYAVTKNISAKMQFTYRNLRAKGAYYDHSYYHQLDGDAYGIYLGAELNF